MNRPILSLTTAQVIYWFAVLVSISLSSVIGVSLAPSPALATLPYALISFSALAATFFLSRLIARFGWRNTLMAGAGAGVGAALLSIFAVLRGEFALFCLACLVMGLYQASAVYYRLAAIALAPVEHKGRAIGWVLSGSLIAAFLGPSLASLAATWVGASVYAGPYLLTALLSALAIPALGFLPKRDAGDAQAPSMRTTASDFMQRRAYQLGTFNTAFAQGVMILMMVMAPLSMHQSGGFHLHQGVSVIGWHLVGMFLPSYFSGRLLDLMPARRLILGGLALLGLSALAAIQGQTLTNYYVSLFLLGAGWNLMYVAGTWQYNRTLNDAERSRAQGRAEFVVALAALVGASAGSALLVNFTWPAINAALLLVLVGVLLINLLSQTHDKRDN